MRLPLACLAFTILVALAAPAFADPANEADYRAANEAFLGGASDRGVYGETYGARVMKNIEGKWATLVTAPYGGAFLPFLVKSCEVLPFTIRAEGDRTFIMTKTDRKGGKFDMTFTQIAGNMFGLYTPPDPLFAYFGLNDLKDPKFEISRSNLLRNMNGIASVIRFSDGILVIQVNYAVPSVYGRCE